MDAFETVVAALLEREGYWTRTCVKLNLPKEAKRDAGCACSPRPELDIVAYRPKDGRLLIVECKSFLDSAGVRFQDVSGNNEKEAKRYKLFTNQKWRDGVLTQLMKELEEQGFCPSPAPMPTLCLAAGNVYNDDEKRIRQLFAREEWVFYGPSDLREKLEQYADKSCLYENSVAAIVAKLIGRNKDAKTKRENNLA